MRNLHFYFRFYFLYSIGVSHFGFSNLRETFNTVDYSTDGYQAEMSNIGITAGDFREEALSDGTA